VVSLNEYKLSQFCPNPDCGTLLNLCPQPKHWLFQFNPKIYRWFERIRDTKEPEQWLTSRYAKYIHKGDLVAIWASGEKAGIYAVGEIITNPAKKQLNANQHKYWIDETGIYKFQEKDSVFIKYLNVTLDQPILQDECRGDPVLFELQVFNDPQGTNFRLTYEQWDRILQLMNRKRHR